MEFKSSLDLVRAIVGSERFSSLPPVRRGRGKVAGTRKTSEVIIWPDITAAQFDRLPGHEKTALYFATCLSVVWQTRWHNNFQLAFDSFRDQLVIQDRKRRGASRA